MHMLHTQTAIMQSLGIEYAIGNASLQRLIAWVGMPGQMETFQEYLAARRTRSANGSAHGSTNGEAASQRAREEAAKLTRSRLRAVKNWKRAKYAVTKKITQDMLGVQRRCRH